MLSDTELAYLAGLIDGEGCFYISATQGRYFQGKLIIVGTVHKHMEEVAAMADVGKTFFTAKKRPKADKTQWHILDHDCLSFTKQVLPYLRMKTDQAKLMILFLEHKKNSPSYNRFHPIPAGVLRYRQTIADTMKEMKLNGKTFDFVDMELVAEFPEEHRQLPLFRV